MQSLHRVEKSPPSDGTGSITAGDLSTQSIIGAVCISPPYRHIPPLEMTVAAGTTVHPFATSWPSSPKGDARSVTVLAVCVICDTISSATYFLVSP